MTILLGLMSGVLGAVVGSWWQAKATRDQTASDTVHRHRDRIERAEDARLDRLERGVAQLRASALTVGLQAERLTSLPAIARVPLGVGLVNRIEQQMTSLVEASTLVRVNGDQEIALTANNLLSHLDEVMTWVGSGPDAWKVQPPALAEARGDVIALEREMRSRRGLEPLPSPCAGTTDPQSSVTGL